MTRRIHMDITIDPSHPLIELLGGIGLARTLLRALGEATLRGLAHQDPELAEVTRLLITVVKRETGAELDTASDLPITDESTELVLRLRARVVALGKVEHALRSDYRATSDPEETLP